MMLDQLSIRGFADHGETWNDFSARAITRAARLLVKGARSVRDQSLDHLRNLALLMAALVISAGFIGIAVLPGAVALGLTT